MRAGILNRTAERFILDPLKTHGWTATTTPSTPVGEAMLITATRAGETHTVALLYSAYTASTRYVQLAKQAEHIFYQGDKEAHEQFSRGVKVPVSPASDFGATLLKWNSETTQGKFGPDDGVAAHEKSIAPPVRRLLAEEPIDAIWLRLRQLQSLTLARKLVIARAAGEGTTLGIEAVTAKAQGIAFALRNAADYFTARDMPNVSQRILNYYYGSMAFASAEMLARPSGAGNLAEIEKATVQGHGLYTIDGATGDLESMVVGGNSNGFFTTWLRTAGMAAPAFPQRKARNLDELKDLPVDSWVTIEQLFGSIPDLADLYADIFDSKPRWIKPVYDAITNMGVHGGAGQKKARQSYIKLVDLSARMNKEDLIWLPASITEITPITSDKWGRHFRARVDHPDHELWWGAVKVHNSPFERNAFIQPIFGSVDEFRAICFALLYALSIVVRYRPSLWRRVQEGDLDHLRVLTEAFLAIVSRVLPEEFLASITGQPVSVHQPGSFFS